MMSTDKSFADRVVVVTGATGGIGEAICRLFADAGASLVLSDLSQSELDPLAASISADGMPPLTQVCDITSSDSVERLRDATLASFGRVDVLCNAAGVDSVFPVVSLTEAEWDRVLDVNLKGVFLACRAMAPPMIRARYGKIVNVASVGAFAAAALEAHYCASKSGVIGFTQALAMELAYYNINVNAVCPGAVYTPMLRSLMEKFSDRDPESYYKEVMCEGRHYFQRPIEANDIAEAVLWLASERSRNVTGQALLVTQMTEMRRPEPGMYFELEEL
jgi:NAD(P)-dependent dehydrogenase (short-subunit alcohol dehydrogenase family)